MKRFRFDLQAALDFASHQVELHEMEIYRLEAQRTELSGLRDQTQKTIFESVPLPSELKQSGSPVLS